MRNNQTDPHKKAADAAVERMIAEYRKHAYRNPQEPDNFDSLLLAIAVIATAAAAAIGLWQYAGA